MTEQPAEPAALSARSDEEAVAMSQAMQQAARAYGSGQWAEAEQWCRNILAARGDYFDALNLLGIIAAQTGRTEEAADLLGRSVAANPGDAGAHSNYGNVLSALQRFKDALDSYERALKLKPDYAEAYNNRGLILQKLKRFEDALDSYARALQLRPDHAGAYNNRGLTLQELKRFDDALDSYERALKLKPDYAEAYYNRGVALQELKRFDDALDSYERALKLKPDYADAHNNRGVALQELKRYEDALDSYERALKLKPDYAEAHSNRGVALQELKRFEDALDSYARALQIKPDHADAYNNRGNALRELKRPDDALDSYARALKLKPDYAEAYNNRGVALQELKRPDDALDSFERALKLKPDYAEAYNNRGAVLQELKRPDDALDSFERALKLKPDYAEAYNNRGAALQELKRFDDALDSYARALEIKPDYAEAYNNRGFALQELKRFDDALDSYARALEIKPDYAEAHSNLGGALQELKRFEDALGSYERALKINPDCDWLYGLWLYTRLQLCEWSDLASQVTAVVARIGQGKRTTSPFPVLALIDSLSVQRAAAETWVREKHPPSRALPPLEKRGHRHDKIRVGYFSGDYRDHPVAFLTAEMFEKHDRSRFEVNAFSFGPDTQDEMRKRMERAFDRFIDVRGKSDLDVVRLARTMELDIAVDLGGFTEGCRPNVFALRAAPLQVNYLGYAGTMGAEYIDYIVADQTLIPKESHEQYSERIVYLPNSYQVNDRKRPIAGKEFSRAELGLPATGFVFCCFNNSFKINPDTFDGWMRILRQVTGSVLWLAAVNETAANNLRKEAESRGVAAGRLLFARRMASFPEHLARYRTADLFIDTLPYNAHATASDALWAGLPVLTRRGESYAARVGASLLNAIGLPELVTTTPEQYEATAIELASNPARLAEFKDKLRRNRLTMPLFDTEQFTRHLENAYTQMYERYQADLSPEHIYVTR
jgi:protein O-GlcNAc transferase